MFRHRSPLLTLLLAVCCLIAGSCLSQENEIGQRKSYLNGDQKQTLVHELRFTKGNWITRFRPYAYSLHSGTYHIELMSGLRIGKPSFNYAYLRWNNNDQAWLGLRSDYALKLANKKLSLNSQARWFAPLKEGLGADYYLIESATWNFGKFKAGAFGMYRHRIFQDANMYVGPSLVLPINKDAGLFVTYLDDLNDRAHLLLALLYYKFNFKGKSGSDTPVMEVDPSL